MKKAMKLGAAIAAVVTLAASSAAKPSAALYYSRESWGESFTRYIDQVLATVIEPAKTEDEKVKLIYDFVIYQFAHRDTKTREDAAKTIALKKLQLPDVSDYSGTATNEEAMAYSLFRNGEGVCDHFAAAFAVMLNRAGIECETWGGNYVSRSGSKMPHAFNRAKIDGQWYWFDVDVEGTVFRRDTGRILYFLYKNSDDEMRKTHADYKLTHKSSGVTEFNAGGALPQSVKGGAAGARNGEKLGDVLYTDIRAYINGAEIAAYNIEGSVYVIASDLRAYGFGVIYSDSARSTSVTYSGAAPAAPPKISAALSGGKVGAPAFPYLYTDIQAYVDGELAPSKNVNGNVAIPFNTLSVFGSYKYDGAARKCVLTAY